MRRMLYEIFRYEKSQKNFTTCLIDNLAARCIHVEKTRSLTNAKTIEMKRQIIFAVYNYSGLFNTYKLFLQYYNIHI